MSTGRLKKVYRGDYRRPYRDDPPPRRDLLPRHGFLTTTSLIATRGCHNRCGFCYLSTDGLHMPYLVRDVEQIVGRVPRRRSAVCRVHRQQPRLASRVLAAAMPRPAAAGEDLECRRVDRRDRRPITRARDGSGRMHGRFRGFRIARRTKHRRRAEEDARGRPTTPAAWRCCTTMASRSTAASCSASITTGRTCSRGRSSGSKRTGWSARRSTSSRPTPARRYSDRWKRKAGCCTRIGRGTTRLTSSSARGT